MQQISKYTCSFVFLFKFLTSLPMTFRLSFPAKSLISILELKFLQKPWCPLLCNILRSTWGDRLLQCEVLMASCPWTRMPIADEVLTLTFSSSCKDNPVSATFFSCSQLVLKLTFHLTAKSIQSVQLWQLWNLGSASQAHNDNSKRGEVLFSIQKSCGGQQGLCFGDTLP